MSLLVVRSVSKSFRGLQALSDVSFTVEPGTILGIIGPNGAGKTTLFNAIAGSFRPDSGSVTFADTDITGWPDYRIARSGLARTFQLMRPFGSMSVLENVTIAASTRLPYEAAHRFAYEILERVGLADAHAQLSTELSTAGLKRLELARALALQPQLLLLDEVLAGLVPAEREPLIGLLRDLRGEGLTMLFVEHVMAAVMQLSDSVLVLNQGQVLAQDTPARVTQDQRVIDAYLGEEFFLAES